MRAFTYTATKSVDHAVDALRSAPPGTRILAGGTTLYDLMKLGIETPVAVIDVNRIAELGGVDVRESGLVLGAGARMADVARHPAVRTGWPALAESVALAASPQLRVMASVGGNLLQRTRCSYFRGGAEFPCNKRSPGSGCAAIGGHDRAHALFGGSDACVATYPGDLAVALIACDAVVDVVSARGERTVPVAELHVEPGDRPDREHVLAADELLVRLRIPLVCRGSAYFKIRDRESYSFALASCAALVVLDADGHVDECRIVLGGVATRPWRADEAANFLTGQRLTAQTARQAAEIAFAAARPGTHNGFRVELGRRAVAEGLRIARERAS